MKAHRYDIGLRERLALVSLGGLIGMLFVALPTAIALLARYFS